MPLACSLPYFSGRSKPRYPKPVPFYVDDLTGFDLKFPLQKRLEVMPGPVMVVVEKVEEVGPYTSWRDLASSV